MRVVCERQCMTRAAAAFKSGISAAKTITAALPSLLLTGLNLNLASALMPARFWRICRRRRVRLFVTTSKILFAQSAALRSAETPVLMFASECLPQILGINEALSAELSIARNASSRLGASVVLHLLARMKTMRRISAVPVDTNVAGDLGCGDRVGSAGRGPLDLRPGSALLWRAPNAQFRRGVSRPDRPPLVVAFRH